jgi:hypothetical protein
LIIVLCSCRADFIRNARRLVESFLKSFSRFLTILKNQLQNAKFIFIFEQSNEEKMQETLIIDGHVHVYPMFDLKKLLETSRKNFIKSQRASANRDETVKIWLLTERSDCSFFSRAPETAVDGFLIERGPEAETLLVKDAGTHEPLLYIFAGHQLVTREGLELCALATLFSAPDRALSAERIIRDVNESGGIAALNWAPGKWFGARGRIVQQIFDETAPEQLMISDTTMRPTLWRTPRMMKAAAKKGFRIIRGSDPLPFSGEEALVASYAFLVQGDFDDSRPAASVRKILSISHDFIPCGRRSGTTQFSKRQYRIMREKKIKN